MSWWRRLRNASAVSDRRGRAEFAFPHTRINANRLVEECEAFLSGRLVDQMAERIPVWTWTNLLAHGSEEDLRAAASIEPSGDEWRKARASLAANLLATASTYGPLDEVQRRVLIPLELELASRPEVPSWESRGWASTVERALETYRRQCRRSSEH